MLTLFVLLELLPLLALLVIPVIIKFAEYLTQIYTTLSISGAPASCPLYIQSGCFADPWNDLHSLFPIQQCCELPLTEQRLWDEGLLLIHTLGKCLKISLHRQSSAPHQTFLTHLYRMFLEGTLLLINIILLVLLPIDLGHLLITFWLSLPTVTSLTPDWDLTMTTTRVSLWTESVTHSVRWCMMNTYSSENSFSGGESSSNPVWK